MAEVIRHRNAQRNGTLAESLERVAAVSYLLGTILFAIGSIFFLSEVGFFVAGAWLFILGSVLFTLGACVNVLQIVEAQSLLVLQLMNLTAIAFAIGSVLFLVALGALSLACRECRRPLDARYLPRLAISGGKYPFPSGRSLQRLARPDRHQTGGAPLVHRSKQSVQLFLEKLMQNQRDSAVTSLSYECATALVV